MEKWKIILVSLIGLLASLTICHCDESDQTKSFYAAIGLKPDNEVVDIVLLEDDDSVEAADTPAIVLIDDADLDLLDHRTLIKLHGSFMVIAWMGTTTVGVLIAR